MSHQPPIPEHNKSPYPIAEPPHQPLDQANISPGDEDEVGGLTIADRASAILHDVPSLSGRTVIGVGAAIALGVAATVSALLFAQRKPPASRRRTSNAAAPAAPRKTAPSRSRKTPVKS